MNERSISAYSDGKDSKIVLKEIGAKHFEHASAGRYSLSFNFEKRISTTTFVRMGGHLPGPGSTC